MNLMYVPTHRNVPTTVVVAVVVRSVSSENFDSLRLYVVMPGIGLDKY